MDIWIMNLKDNRDDKTELEKSKFDFCKDKGIVGIGWVGFDSTASNDAAFLKASTTINTFNCDDLVWVHNTVTKEYYICQITGQATSSENEEFKEYDIGTYCTCKYYYVGNESNLPEGITAKDLVSRSTVSSTNENVSKISISYFSTLSQSTSQTNESDNSVSAAFYGTSQNPKKKSKKKKVIIVCASIVSVIALIILGIIGGKAIIKSTHPVLPNNWNFGDTPEMVETALPLTEDKIDKSYSQFVDVSAEELNSYFKLKKTAIDDSNPVVLQSYNSDKKLYFLTVLLTADYDTSLEIVKYYEKALDMEAYQITNSNGYDIALYCDDVSVTINYKSNTKSLMITTSSSQYSPTYFNASETDLNNAYSSCKYQFGGGMFSMGLKELLNLCAPDSQATYIPYREARSSSKDQLLTLKKNGLFDSLEKSDIAQYLSSSYIIFVHGDICSNPEMPYYRSNDVDIISVLIVFDESGDYKGYKILDYCDDLHTYATLHMAGYYY